MLRKIISGPLAMAFVVVAVVLVVGVHAYAAPASGIAAIPEVNVNESDLSTQLFNKIFGQGWANLSAKVGTGGDGSSGPTLIFTLLGTLNTLCAIAVAWMVILTLIVGSIGAANEGKALAGKHSSPWVPIRFAFSFAAIAPVFAGLNAMQILILAGIGMSIDMANTMWKTGLDYVAAYGSINAEVPSRVGETARTLTAGAMRSQALMGYLARQVGCQFERVGDWTDAGDAWIFYYSVPQTCLPGDTNLQQGDLGGFRVQKAKLGNMVEQAKVVDKSRTDALAGIVNTLNPLATKIGDKRFTKSDYKSVFEAANIYATTISQGLAQIAVHADPNRQEGMNAFVEMAGERGWLMAGSYYWILAEANSRVVEAMDDDTQYIPAAWEALVSARILYRDWDSYVEPNLKELSEALARSPVKTETETLQAIGNTSSIKEFFNFIFEMPARLLTGMAKDRTDAILEYSNTARSILFGIEGTIGATLAVKALASGGAKWADTLWGAVGNFFSGGAVAAGTGAAESLAESVFLLVLAVGLPLYLVFWTFAFIIPAIPFMTWIAAIVGWIVLCVEAVIAAPLWLVGHSMPEGEGFAGVSGRAGYTLFLSVLLRPVLLVLSMFVCMILMSATGSLIHTLYTPFMNVSGITFTTGNIGLASTVALLVILGTVIAMLTWKMFELTTAMPDRIIRWVGQLLANLGDEGKGMGQQATSHAQSMGKEVMSSGGKGLSDMRKAGKEANRQNKYSGQGKDKESNIAQEMPFEIKDPREDKKDNM